MKLCNITIKDIYTQHVSHKYMTIPRPPRYNLIVITMFENKWQFLFIDDDSLFGMSFVEVNVPNEFVM